MVGIKQKANITGDVNVYAIINMEEKTYVESIMNGAEYRELCSILNAEEVTIDLNDLVFLPKSEEDEFIKTLNIEQHEN